MARFFKIKRKNGLHTLRPKVNVRQVWQVQGQEVNRSKAFKRSLGRGHRIFSRFFRKVFENPRVRTVFGANLAFLTVLSGLVRSYSGLAFGAVPLTGMTSQILESQEVSLATKNSVVKPMARYDITQGFSIFHPAIDLSADVGDVVHPVMAGVVMVAGWDDSGYGNTVVVQHDNGYASRYAHLSRVSVHVGDSVTTDSVIGLVGVTGRSSGPHLHLEIYLHGLPINPRSLLE